tara:strand:+ start:312 stop:527 length:216 start_codon:yes stop_codon:yes gene_type:complete
MGGRGVRLNAVGQVAMEEVLRMIDPIGIRGSICPISNPLLEMFQPQRWEIRSLVAVAQRLGTIMRSRDERN